MSNSTINGVNIVTAFKVITARKFPENVRAVNSASSDITNFMRRALQSGSGNPDLDASTIPAVEAPKKPSRLGSCGTAMWSPRGPNSQAGIDAAASSGMLLQRDWNALGKASTLAVWIRSSTLNSPHLGAWRSRRLSPPASSSIIHGMAVSRGCRACAHLGWFRWSSRCPSCCRRLVAVLRLDCSSSQPKLRRGQLPMLRRRRWQHPWRVRAHRKLLRGAPGIRIPSQV
jgi:hypothetical protein